LSRLAEIDIEEAEGVYVARLDGELDLSNVVDVGDALASTVSDDAIGLVVDMAGIRHIDSAGVRMLFDLRRRLRQRRQGFALAVPPDARIRDVLELAAVGDTVPLVVDVDAALEAVRSD
jgi:anti-sigma B factor antagonist